MSLYKADIFRLARHGETKCFALLFPLERSCRQQNRKSGFQDQKKRGKGYNEGHAIRPELSMPGRNKSKVVFHPVKKSGMFQNVFLRIVLES